MRLLLAILLLTTGTVAGACGTDELRLRPVVSGDTSAAALEATRQALEARLQSLGHVDVRVVLDSGGFVVKMPPDQAPAALLVTLAAPGRVTFVAIPANAEPPPEGAPIDPRIPELLGPDAVTPGSARLGTSPITGGTTVEFRLTEAAAEVFRRHTSAHTGDFFAVVVDGTVVSVPMIQGEIPNGEVLIESGGAAEPTVDMMALAAYLASGPLPVAIAPPAP